MTLCVYKMFTIENLGFPSNQNDLHVTEADSKVLSPMITFLVGIDFHQNEVPKYLNFRSKTKGYKTLCQMATFNFHDIFCTYF